MSGMYVHTEVNGNGRKCGYNEEYLFQFFGDKIISCFSFLDPECI